MRFSTMTLFNFKAFSGEHVIELVGPHGGLRFLTSENQADPDLEANGCGKSTIWDALFWAFFGRALRGVKAANIRTWGGKGPTWVKLPFSIGDDSYVLYRSGNPNKLTLEKNNGTQRDVDQEEVNSLVGLNSDAFQNSIIMGQFSKMFFDMKPAEKMAMFTDILNLEDWEVWSKDAGKLAKETFSKLSVVQNSILSSEAVLDTLDEQIDITENLSRDHDGQIKKELAKNNDLKTQAEKDLKRARLELKKTKSDHECELSNHISDVTAVNFEKMLKKSNKEMTDIKVELGINFSKKDGIDEQLDDLDRTKEKCPTCQQTISRSHIQAEKKKLQTKKDKLEENLTALNTDYDCEKALNDVILGDVAKYKKTEGIICDLLRKFERYEHHQKHVINNAMNDIKTVDSVIDDLTNRKNPHTKVLNTLDIKLRDTESNIERAKGKSVALNKEALSYEFWVKGFKEIRLMLIDEALLALEIEVNNNLIQLGLSGWEIGFEVERETNAGGVSKGFTVYVISPRNDDLVPWECWSGGETQRLALAGTLGLCDLILNQRGIDTNLEVYDEPTPHLSDKGVRQLTDLLQQRAHETGKQLWLVDHRMIDFGGFESVVKVVKDSGGAKLDIN